MRRLTVLAGAFGAALLMNCGAFAQVAADSNNPNEAVPDAMAPPPYGETINTETAKKVATAAIAVAQKRNWNGFCVAVVGPSGDLVYFEKQDNCQFASTTISQHKARTAARYRRPTVVFERLLGKGDFFAYLTTLRHRIARRQSVDGGRQGHRRDRRERRCRLAGRRRFAGRRGGIEVNIAT